MVRFAFLALAVAILTGCTADLDQVMGRVDGTPTTAPAPERKIDCDLIFPGVDRR